VLARRGWPHARTEAAPRVFLDKLLGSGKARSLLPAHNALSPQLKAEAKTHPRPDPLRARRPATVSLPQKAPSARTAADELSRNLIAN
jgi:hypothetical protein